MAGRGRFAARADGRAGIEPGRRKTNQRSLMSTPILDPSLPADHSPLVSGETRGQFIGLANQITACKATSITPGKRENWFCGEGPGRQEVSGVRLERRRTRRPMCRKLSGRAELRGHERPIHRATPRRSGVARTDATRCARRGQAPPMFGQALASRNEFVTSRAESLPKYELRAGRPDGEVPPKPFR